MKRNLIVVIAVLGLAANAAFAEPTLQSEANVLKMAPEATSYVADTQQPTSRSLINERDDLQPFNP